jgi:hypothetical protein
MIQKLHRVGPLARGDWRHKHILALAICNDTVRDQRGSLPKAREDRAEVEGLSTPLIAKAGGG